MNKTRLIATLAIAAIALTGVNGAAATAEPRSEMRPASAVAPEGWTRKGHYPDVFHCTIAGVAAVSTTEAAAFDCRPAGGGRDLWLYYRDLLVADQRDASVIPDATGADAQSSVLLRPVVEFLKSLAKTYWDDCVKAVRGGWSAFVAWWNRLDAWVRETISQLSQMTVEELFKALCEYLSGAATS
ncbi:hypothetical protein [Actinokineospora sp.]|uniref:hypothetical protein n=1 Tax=Actinokineospora sp. TaxID=1872133 RepID=UPI003D6AC34A